MADISARIGAASELSKRGSSKNREAASGYTVHLPGTEVRLPRRDSRGERSRARNELAADIIPRIISAARLTRSALRFPVAGRGRCSAIDRSIDPGLPGRDDDGLRKRKRSRRKGSGSIEKEGKKRSGGSMETNGKGRGRAASRMPARTVNREVDE